MSYTAGDWIDNDGQTDGQPDGQVDGHCYRKDWYINSSTHTDINYKPVSQRSFNNVYFAKPVSSLQTKLL